MSASKDEIKEYGEEANNLLDQFESALLGLDANPSNRERINEMFREIHSVKGDSGIMGVLDVHDVATEMENRLDTIRKATGPVDRQDIEMLFVMLDKLRDTLRTALEHRGIVLASSAARKAQEDELRSVPSAAAPAPIAKATAKAKPAAEPAAKPAVSAPADSAGPKQTAAAPKPPSAPAPQAASPVHQSAGQLPPEDEINKYLTFRLGKDEYGVELVKVFEIVTMNHITPVPNTRNYFYGLMNLRGQVIPVFRTDLRIGYKSKQKSESGTEERQNIIITQLRKSLTGLIVDDVTGIVDLEQKNIDRRNTLQGQTDSKSLLGIGKHKDKTVILIDLEKVCDPEEKVF